jgi:thiol-disulfide isomerase/thioredoxin
MRPALCALLLTIAAACGLLLPGHSSARVAPWDIEKLPSSPAPACSLPDLNGTVVASNAFQGQVLLINFWATWCAPCREEMPALERLQQKLKGKGFSVIAIAVDSDKAPVAQFVSQHQTSLPVLHDPDMTCHDEYKVFSYPTTFLVDRQGVIRKYWIGPQEWDSDSFVTSIQTLVD